MGKFIRTFPKTKGFQKKKQGIKKSSFFFLLLGVYRKDNKTRKKERCYFSSFRSRQNLLNDFQARIA